MQPYRGWFIQGLYLRNTWEAGYFCPLPIILDTKRSPLVKDLQTRILGLGPISHWKRRCLEEKVQVVHKIASKKQQFPHISLCFIASILATVKTTTKIRMSSQDLWSALETTMASVVFLDSQCLWIQKNWGDVEGANWMKDMKAIYTVDFIFF